MRRSEMTTTIEERDCAKVYLKARHENAGEVSNRLMYEFEGAYKEVQSVLSTWSEFAADYDTCFIYEATRLCIKLEEILALLGVSVRPPLFYDPSDSNGKGFRRTVARHVKKLDRLYGEHLEQFRED